MDSQTVINAREYRWCGELLERLAAPKPAQQEKERKALHKKLFEARSSCRLSHDRILTGILGVAEFRCENTVAWRTCRQARSAFRPIRSCIVLG